MISGFDETWKGQKDEDIWKREHKCVEILNHHFPGDKIQHHTVAQMREKYDCIYRGCKIELEERKENVILNDRYMFAPDRGLSALDRKILECFDPARTLMIIYGYNQGALYGYCHTFERYRRDGIKQNYGGRKDSYFVLLKEKAGNALPADRLAARVRYLCESIQLQLPFEDD